MENIETWKLVLGLLAVLCSGTRAAGWIRAVLSLLKILTEGTERTANAIAPASTLPLVTVKDFVKDKMAVRRGEVLDLADKFAAKAEAATGVTNGKATKRLKESKGKRFAKGLARWAPVVGAFL